MFFFHQPQEAGSLVQLGAIEKDKVDEDVLKVHPEFWFGREKTSLVDEQQSTAPFIQDRLLHS